MTMGSNQIQTITPSNQVQYLDFYEEEVYKDGSITPERNKVKSLMAHDDTNPILYKEKKL